MGIYGSFINAFTSIKQKRKSVCPSPAEEILSTCKLACAHICKYVCMYIYIYIHTHLYTCICVYIYIYIYIWSHAQRGVQEEAEIQRPRQAALGRDEQVVLLMYD